MVCEEIILSIKIREWKLRILFMFLIIFEVFGQVCEGSMHCFICLMTSIRLFDCVGRNRLLCIFVHHTSSERLFD